MTTLAKERYEITKKNTEGGYTKKNKEIFIPFTILLFMFALITVSRSMFNVPLNKYNSMFDTSKFPNGQNEKKLVTTAIATVSSVLVYMFLTFFTKKRQEVILFYVIVLIINALCLLFMGISYSLGKDKDLTTIKLSTMILISDAFLILIFLTLAITNTINLLLICLIIVKIISSSILLLVNNYKPKYFMFAIVFCFVFTFVANQLLIRFL